MKQFGKILKFELKGYMRNKIFVGITIFLVVAIAVVMFIPNISSAFKSEDEGTTNVGELPIMLVHAEDESLAGLVKEYFTGAFTGYNVTVAEGTVDDVKNKITSGEAECAFVMNSASSYTYYVNNLSMYDTNTAIADTMLQEVYRVNAMVQNGLTPEQASEIMSVQIESETTTLGKDQMQNFFYTYIMIFALYMVILLYGQMVATNVASEKSSRAMEVLITSAKPTGMMFGKVLASCIAGLVQLVAVFGSALIFYNINKDAWGDNMIVQSIFNIPVDLFVYMLVFFVLGFLIYAFMYGAIGSTASKLEDINTSVMPITFLFIIAFMVVMFSMTSGSVDTTLMKVCSYIPFTSPMAMFTRLCMSTVAWYEIALSIVILIGSTVGIGVLAAKIYRVGVLMYGNSPKITSIIKNKKYIGEDGYPAIVSDADYERAYNLKSQKGVKKVEYSPEVEYLKEIIVCSQCGKKLYRHATWSKREKWFCTNGCKNDIYVGDQEIFDAITDAFVKAKSNLQSVENDGKVETYNPSLAIVRQNNEINRLMDQSNVQFQTVKKLILQCVEMKFECCSENKSESHTVYIKESLERWDTDEAALSLMKKIVDTISLEKDGSITITLINQAKIIGRR